MSILNFNIDELFKERVYLYRLGINGMGIAMNVFCNSFLAHSWMFSLVKSVYECSGKIFEKPDFSIYCLYDKEIFRNFQEEMLKEQMSACEFHHYTKALYAEIEQSRIIYSEKTTSIFWVFDDKIYILGEGLNADSFLEYSRVIREVLTKKAEQKGYILVHASAIEKNGLVYIFTGEKGAGKTTTMLNLMRKGYNIVSNDRVFIYKKNEALYCITWPGCVAVSIDTIFRQPELYGISKELRYLAYPQQRIKCVDEFYINPQKYYEKNPKDKFDLTCEEVANLYDVKYVSGGKVSSVINIYCNQKTEIEDNFLSPCDKSYPNWLMLVNDDERKELKQHLKEVDELVRRNLVELKMLHDEYDICRIESELKNIENLK